MGDKIGIWTVRTSPGGGEFAEALEELEGAETEARLESLLVRSPEILLPGLTLIGRQVVTGGGPLDLIGIDSEGRLVVFELKRGMLTRDAVAQILDYASDLAAQTPEEFALLVQQNSGRNGIEPIEDFVDWYQGEFPDVTERPPSGMRLVLVGLGVDERARRIVNYLAGAGVDVQLLTFQAFRAGSTVFLARRLETVQPLVRDLASGGGQKEQNQRQLNELAREQGVQDLLAEVADFVGSRMPSYRWPGKTAIGYYLAEQTDEGKPTQRAYATVTVDPKTRGRLIFSLPPRAVEGARESVAAIVGKVPEAKMVESVAAPFRLAITTRNWESLKEPLASLVDAVFHASKEKVRTQGAQELAETASMVQVNGMP